jgi:TPR repeat protein
MAPPETVDGDDSSPSDQERSRCVNLLVPLWSDCGDYRQRQEAKATAIAQVAKSIFRASPKRPSKACRQLLLFMLAHEGLSLSRILTERIESHQVGELTKGLAAMAESDAAGDDHAYLFSFRAFMRLPPGDQLLAMVELRNILERWAMSPEFAEHCLLELAAFRDDLRAYFGPQQWSKPRKPTARQAFRFARDLHEDSHPFDTRAFLRVLAWALVAARMNYAPAECIVGYYFAECKDSGRYLFWTRRAAAHGSVVALFNLGTSYSRGADGVLQNDKAALSYLLQAEKNGYKKARSEIGNCYIRLRNYALARRWLRRAISCGSRHDEYALSGLGFLYEHGLGVSPSKRLAIKYYSSAAKTGFDFAKKATERLGAVRLV